ncbi:hypothetical protein BD626DRAFT_525378, partial [Schizophyllum amplum]
MRSADGRRGLGLPPKTADNIRMRLYRVFHQTRREHVEEVPSRQAVEKQTFVRKVVICPRRPNGSDSASRDYLALSTVSFALTILPPHLSSPFKTTRPLSRLRSSVLGAPARILVPAPLHAYPVTYHSIIDLSPSGFRPSSTTPSSRSSTLTTTAGPLPTSIPRYQPYIMAHSPRAHRILTLSWTCYTIDLFEMLRFS